MPMTEDKRLLAALATMTENVDSNYALGGRISCTPTGPESGESSSTVKQPANRAVTLRWDGTFSVNKISFPLPAINETKTLHQSSLQALVNACQPATFGRLGEDVLDESYRKAGKLDEECFSTNFHPADWGITDAVAQALLPNVGEGHSGLRGVHAELYKLSEQSGARQRVLRTKAILQVYTLGHQDTSKHTEIPQEARRNLDL